MSIGSLGIVGGLAGAPLAQSKGSDVEKAQQDVSGQARQVRSEVSAQSASGIGQTDGEDHQSGERDADGRRLWEGPLRSTPKATGPEPTETRQSRDASGQSGTQLDLTG